jgi:tRNA/tmRNA/rRNA uracil-C5-methylase (TrmA/RlmC/RlmD family)
MLDSIPLSLANRGAHVTGVDIHGAWVAQAQAWAHASGIAATFVQSDVYEWLATTDSRYDQARLLWLWCVVAQRFDDVEGWRGC